MNTLASAVVANQEPRLAAFTLCPSSQSNSVSHGEGAKHLSPMVPIRLPDPRLQVGLGEIAQPVPVSDRPPGPQSNRSHISSLLEGQTPP